jgi:hypothetical protein
MSSKQNKFLIYQYDGTFCHKELIIIHFSLLIDKPSGGNKKYHYLFLESPRRIGNWVLSSRRRISNQVRCSPRIFFNNISMSPRSLQCKSKFSENCRFSCQSFSEILRISEKLWHETHQNLKWMSKSKEYHLYFKTNNGFYSGLHVFIQAKKPH